MGYYKTCPYCGAHLDPGEICDCRERDAARDADNTPDGKAEQIDKPVSASIITKKRG